MMHGSSSSSDDSSSEEEPDFPWYGYFILFTVLFGWICFRCYMTRGCTDGCYKNRGGASNPLEDDHRNQMLEQQAREQQEAERQAQQVKLRRDFVNHHLPTFIYKNSKNNSSLLLPKNQDNDLEAPVTDDSDKDDDDDSDNDERATPGGGATCAICRERFQNGDRMTRSDLGKCCHYFHKDCLVPWLVQKPECPICRNTFLKMEGNHLQGLGPEGELIHEC